MKKYNLLFLLIVLFLTISCTGQQTKLTLSGLIKENFQSDFEGEQTDLFVLKNKHGMEVCVTNYGARVVSVMVPGRSGEFQDVVGGFSSIKEYTSQQQNFGALIGRYIGRIKDAQFTLDGVKYQLKANKDTHTAHGGEPGFASRVWIMREITDNSVRLHYLSPSGENGFPGNLSVDVIYTITNDNELDIKYEATTDEATVLNLSNHSFFNISGDFTSTVEDQVMYVNADRMTPYDSTKCVTGEIVSVKDTPFDFTSPTIIGERIDEDNEQLKITGGYDHTWVLNTKTDSELAVKLIDPRSGRTLEVYTTEPGVQIYTGNGLSGKVTGKGKIPYYKRSSVCFETMHFQDSPNHENFPSTALRPGEVFRSHTVFKFGVEK